jgi:uncharacterized protein YjbJ (UPF0337 family)
MGEFVEKLKGKAKEVAGALAGDRALVLEGQLEQMREELKRQLRAANRVVRRTVHRADPGRHDP